MRGILHAEDFWAAAPRKSGGGSGGGSNTQTTVSNTQPPPQFQAGLSSALTQGQAAASAPYQNYPGQLQAGFSPQQMQGFGLVGSTPGIAAPYLNAAAQHYDAATTPLWSGLPQYSADTVGKYFNPYVNSVVDATQAQFNNQNAQAANRLQGDAASRGALGGDRAGVAQAVLQGQEDLSQAPVIANLYNTGFGQAQQEFNQQQGAQLGADQANAWLNSQAGAGFGNLGQEALSTTLASANALMGAGGLQQQQAQQGLNIPFQQWQAQQSYPFQTASWLSGLSSQLANAAGGTASTSAPGPSPFSQGLGLAAGAAGLAGSTGAFNGLFGSGGGSPVNATDTFTNGGNAGFDLLGNSLGMSATGGASADLAGNLFQSGGIFRRGGAVHRAPGGSVPGDELSMSMGSFGDPLGATGEPGGFAVPMGGGASDGKSGLTSNLNPDVSVSYVPPPPNPGQPSQAKQSTSTTTGGGGGSSGGQQALQAIGDVAKIAGVVAMFLNRGGGIRVPHRAPGGMVVTSDPSAKTGFSVPQISYDGSGSGSADEVNNYLAQQKAGAYVPPPTPAPAPAAAAPAPQQQQGQTPTSMIANAFQQGVSKDAAIYGPNAGVAIAAGFPSFRDPRVTMDTLAQQAQAGVPGAQDAFFQAMNGDYQGTGVSATRGFGGNWGAGGFGGGEGGGVSGGGSGGHGQDASGQWGWRGGRMFPRRAEGGLLDYSALANPDTEGGGLLDYSGPLRTPDAAVPVVGANAPPMPEFTMPDTGGGDSVAQGAGPPPPPPPATADTGAPQGPSILADGLAPDSGPGFGNPQRDTTWPPNVHKADPWLALAEAGFTMAAGRSPFAMENIGRAAAAGIASYRSDQRAAEALASKVDEAKARLAETSLYHSGTLDTRRYGIDTRAQIASRAADLRSQGLSETAAWHQAQTELGQGRLAVGQQNADTNRGRAIDSANYHLNRLDQIDQQTALRQQALQETIKQHGIGNDRAAQAAVQKQIQGMNNDALRVYLGSKDPITGKFMLTPEQAQEKAAAVRPTAPAAAKGPAPPVPKVGDVVQGYRYQGGDPGNPASWVAQ